jgi:hypothetical protein
MKFPSHLILDISKQSLSFSNEYWIFKYVFFLKKNNKYIFTNLSLSRKFFLNKEKLILNKLTLNQKKYTINYNLSNESLFLNNNEKNFILNSYKPRFKVKNRVTEANFFAKSVYDYLINSDKKFDEKNIKKLIKFFSKNKFNYILKSNKLWNLFDLNFLRKERIYTKLKYSRVPQYDIVSGGAAAIFAGFLGFLISEKFGFELVDSGDFYFLYMYLVFLFFFLRFFFKLSNSNESSWNPLSLKWLISFYKLILFLILKKINFFFKFFKKLIFN